MSDVTGKIGGAGEAAVFTADRVSYVDTENSGGPGQQGGPRVFIGAPDYRVFIWGVEVTADVFSVSIKNGLNDNISTCMINMVNDNSKYIVPAGLTTAGNKQNFGVSPDEWSEESIDSLVLDNKGTNTQLNPVDTREFARLKIERFRESRDKFINRPISQLLEKFPSGPIFPLVPGMCILQAPDPVRVFLKNPWNLGSTNKAVEGDAFLTTHEEWYYGFTGYIATCTEEFDGNTGRSILRISCEEIRRFLRYMLTTTNTETIAINNPDTSQTPSQGDAGTGSGTGASFELSNTPALQLMINAQQTFEGGMSLPEAYKYVFFGDTLKANPKDQSSQTMNRIAGVPGFDPSRLRQENLSLNPGQLEKDMSSRLEEMYPQLSEDDVSREGAKFEFDEQTLWIILPDPAGWEHDALKNPFSWGFKADFISEFRSRFDILDEFTKRIDAIWYATPKGDVVLEFPQYDQIPMKHSIPWSSILQIQNEWGGFSLTDDDRNIKTFTYVARAPLPLVGNVAGTPFVAFGSQSDPVLQARYGLRVQNFSRPFAHDRNAAVGNENAQAAMIQSLANSDSNRLEGLECLPNFRACVARPYFFKYRNIIGFCTRVQHQVVWGQDARTIYELHYLRPFDSLRNDWVRLSKDYGWGWTGLTSETEAVIENLGLNKLNTGPDKPLFPTVSDTSNTISPTKGKAEAVKSAPAGEYTETQRARAEQLNEAATKALREGDMKRYQKYSEKLDKLVSDNR